MTVRDHLDALDALADRIFPLLANRAMARKLVASEAIDLRGWNTMAPDGPLYRVPDAWSPELPCNHGMDYCDTETERWIHSIGRRITNDELFAATDNRFYGHPDFVCLWLR